MEIDKEMTRAIEGERKRVKNASGMMLKICDFFMLIQIHAHA